MSTNGKTLKFRAAKLKGFTVYLLAIHGLLNDWLLCWDHDVDGKLGGQNGPLQPGLLRPIWAA